MFDKDANNHRRERLPTVEVRKPRAVKMRPCRFVGTVAAMKPLSDEFAIGTVKATMPVLMRMVVRFILNRRGVKAALIRSIAEIVPIKVRTRETR